MDHSLLDDVDDGMWIRHTKATLKLEIEQGYKDMKDFPLLEEGTALTRLSDMYEDPRIGPVLFLKITKMIRNCLRLYRLSKNNPTQFGRFFHCSTPLPGIVLHFNSVTAKKELFVIPSCDQSRQKPAKVHIANIIKWHKNRKAKALATQQKELAVIATLQDELIQEQQEWIDNVRSVNAHRAQIKDFLIIKRDEFLMCLCIQIGTRSEVLKKLHYKKVLDSIVECFDDQEKFEKLEEDFGSLNPRMYDEKEFYQMRIDHAKTLAKYYSDHGKQLQNILSMI